MIAKLDNSKGETSRHIYRVFQDSYEVEAELIGVTEFPPLSRSIEDIAKSQSIFYGYYEAESLAAVIEIELEQGLLHINSLTVAPAHFRKGIAGKLITFVLSEFDFKKAIVETAVANEPAIKLYERYGFVEFKRWVSSHGIKKLALSLGNAS